MNTFVFSACISEPSCTTWIQMTAAWHCNHICTQVDKFPTCPWFSFYLKWRTPLDIHDCNHLSIFTFVLGHLLGYICCSLRLSLQWCLESVLLCLLQLLAGAEQLITFYSSSGYIHSYQSLATFSHGCLVVYTLILDHFIRILCFHWILFHIVYGDEVDKVARFLPVISQERKTLPSEHGTWRPIECFFVLFFTTGKKSELQ